MSSLIRRIQRAPNREGYKGSLGIKLGVHNPNSKDLLTRQKREATRDRQNNSRTTGA